MTSRPVLTLHQPATRPGACCRYDEPIQAGELALKVPGLNQAGRAHERCLLIRPRMIDEPAVGGQAFARCRDYVVLEAKIEQPHRQVLDGDRAIR